MPRTRASTQSASRTGALGAPSLRQPPAARRAGAGVPSSDRERLDELKAKRLTVLTRLDELRAASGDTWEACMVAVEHAWSDFESSFRNLTAS